MTRELVTTLLSARSPSGVTEITLLPAAAVHYHLSVLIAQALGEYGNLVGGESTFGPVQAIEEFFRDATPKTWAVIAVIVFALYWLFLRRRR